MFDLPLYQKSCRDYTNATSSIYSDGQRQQPLTVIDNQQSLTAVS